MLETETFMKQYFENNIQIIPNTKFEQNLCGVIGARYDFDKNDWFFLWKKCNVEEKKKLLLFKITVIYQGNSEE